MQAGSTTPKSSKRGENKHGQRAEKVGSIYMPETQRRPVSTGIIVGMGPMPVEKEKRAPHYELVSQAKAGDRIHIHGHAAVEARLEWGGDAYDIVQSEDVCAVEPAA